MTGSEDAAPTSTRRGSSATSERRTLRACISPELREIHKAAVKLRSVYLSVRDKEKQAYARVDARVKELRTELENVTAGRRKMSSYGAGLTGFGGGSGSSFNSKL